VDKSPKSFINYSPASISLLEDGVYKYTRAYTSRSGPWTAIWYIQHLDVNTAISVDLSNVRAIPLAMASPPSGTYYLGNFKYQQSRLDILNRSLVIGYPPKLAPSTSQQVDRCYQCFREQRKLTIDYSCSDIYYRSPRRNGTPSEDFPRTHMSHL
jgi:hypothetical protein